MLSLALLLVLLFAVAVLIYFAIAANEASKRALQFEAMHKNNEIALNDSVRKLEQAKLKISKLSKYEGIANADDRAKEVLDEANEAADRAKDEAQKILAQARTDSEDITNTARDQARALTSDARSSAKKTMGDAEYERDLAALQAKRIIDDAHKRAEEIAGSAYEAKRNADLYQQTAEAMRNVIEGYGDRYLIPGRSILDDLAEEVGYKEAGQELANARERTRHMVSSRTAATCEYVEDTRRNYAIDFVVDAFNGKVDSILSRVKNDNVGKVEREIKDAFTLVNFNGKAFRDARITEEYLQSRLVELKWAAIAQQIKLEEREEQRRIQGQLRDEEKARKEYEREMKQAAKDEETLRKAMEKVQRQVESANAEQRVKYEQQLQELRDKLKVAEDRNQRAISLSQQTRKGHVYIISNMGSFGEHVYKIGLTRRLEPTDRVRELGDASVPFAFDVHALIFSDDAPALECELQRRLALNRVNKVNRRKEFYKVELREIREHVKQLGANVQWTLMAAAREYQETLAVERAINNDPQARELWMKRQLELEKTAAYLSDEAENVAAKEPDSNAESSTDAAAA